MCSGMHYGGRPRESNPHRKAAHVGIRRGVCSPRLAMALWPCPLVVVKSISPQGQEAETFEGRKAAPAKDPTLPLADSDP